MPMISHSEEQQWWIWWILISQIGKYEKETSCPTYFMWDHKNSNGVSIGLLGTVFQWRIAAVVAVGGWH